MQTSSLYPTTWVTYTPTREPMEEVTDVGDIPPEDRSDLRDALLTQLAYLVDEVEALKSVIGQVPAAIQEGRPTPDALSMKEIYGVIAALDQRVRRPRVEQILSARDETPSFAPADSQRLLQAEDWNALDMPLILRRLQEARQALVDVLEAAPADAWARAGRIDGARYTLFELVHRITQDDAERLRALAHRLHDADLSER